MMLAPEDEPTDDRADLVRAGEPARVSHRIDDAGVTATAEHHQPPIAEAEHQRLVVEDQRIGGRQPSSGSA